ncbi:MAG TPA: zf-HC2 domain-containing protein [Pyrinomonadaceae bacterium]|nr:zf-HC2 domain-containing protein [Pyrinomonadaceae bacterium]
MELEFDKEIDAILRKGRSGQVAAVKAATASHLDADSISAFAENALPPRAKLLYMEHFADCDRCRKDLSQVVRMNSAAVAADGTAVASVAATAAEPAASWLSKLFRTPNLAMAMGALILTFGGVLGYLVIQNRNNTQNSTISKVTNQEQNKGGPFYNGDASAVSNSANAVAANSAAPAAPSMPAAAANTAANTSGSGTGSATGAKQPDSGYALDGTTTDISKSGEVAPAAPVTENKPAAVEERKDSDDKPKERSVDEKRAKSEYDNNMSRDASPGAPRKTDTGATRSGPRQDNTLQNQTQNQIVGGAISATRSSGGKNFESRNGVWYDSAYKGQSTTSVKRGTEKYIRLDSGLRSIADSLGGTVVIVWKDKAYRIQ